jgi:hypothetical protein
MSNSNTPSLDPGSGTFGRRHSARNIGVDATVAHNSVRGYLIGFVLSIILTAIPFGMVMFPGFSREVILVDPRHGRRAGAGACLLTSCT